MTNHRRNLWFWQTEVSPHMAGLTAALARLGCEVTFVANQLVSDERSRQGWALPDLSGARRELVSTVAEVRSLIDQAPIASIHVCQGIRGNGLVGVAQRALARRGFHQWVLMETVNDSGWRGALKRLEYRRLFLQWRRRLQGVLAMGDRTPDWVVTRGMPATQVFPFAYFLSGNDRSAVESQVTSKRFRFIFVGRLDEGKRVDLLISALAPLNRADVELEIIGSGCLEEPLRIAAEAALPGRVIWTGQLPMNLVPSKIAMADCLVLPSRFDGYGAVVSEALMVGTPVICSDRCGAAGVVRASGTGGVFQSCNRSGLIENLTGAMARGRFSYVERLALADWARCLGAEAGARYLINILDYLDGYEKQPSAPWEDVRSGQFDR